MAVKWTVEIEIADVWIADGFRLDAVELADALDSELLVGVPPASKRLVPPLWGFTRFCYSAAPSGVLDRSGLQKKVFKSAFALDSNLHLNIIQNIAGRDTE